MKSLLFGMVIGGLLTSPPHPDGKPAAVQGHGLIGSTKHELRVGRRNISRCGQR
jgi:hypothetical protein